MATTAVMIALDAAAIALLVFGLYFPRHRRADLVAAYLGVNVGVFAVSQILATSAVSAGLGLGLFGVLSIIRLRSSEISQREIAYYFASLALGLLTGLPDAFSWQIAALVALVILSLAVGDSPRLFGAYDTQDVQLDRAIADPAELRAALSDLLGAQVLGVTVVKLDLVNDLTVAQVRLRRVSTTLPRDKGDALVWEDRPADGARSTARVHHRGAPPAGEDGAQGARPREVREEAAS